MIKLSNNFNAITKIIKNCEIKIDILKKTERLISKKEDEVYSYTYLLNATIKAKDSNKFLPVENITINKMDDKKNPETELDVEETGIRLDFSLEESMLMSILSDAGFYQKYLEKDKWARNMVKGWSDTEVFPRLIKMKNYYNFVTEVL